MKKVELIALLTDSKKIIEFLQRRGVVEISSNDDEELDTTNVTAIVGEFEKFRSTVAEALEILNKYSPEKKPVTEMFESRTEVNIDTLDNPDFRLEKTLSIANEIVRSNQEIAEIEKNISQIDVKCDILKQWKNLDIPMNFKGTSMTSAFIGTVPFSITEDFINLFPNGSYMEIISQSKEQTNLFIVCVNDIVDEIRD